VNSPIKIAKAIANFTWTGHSSFTTCAASSFDSFSSVMERKGCFESRLERPSATIVPILPSTWCERSDSSLHSIVTCSAKKRARLKLSIRISSVAILTSGTKERQRR
ncbi:hypothetical protein PFISCL1PPCAC_4394, partial [Pristionchus fissidentatus]